MRKQLKEAAGLLNRAQVILNKVSDDEKIPNHICNKAKTISDALDTDLNELKRMREYA